MTSTAAAPDAAPADPRPLRVLKRSGKILLAVSLLTYPALIQLVNIFAPQRISPDSWIIQDDPVSPVAT